MESCKSLFTLKTLSKIALKNYIQNYSLKLLISEIGIKNVILIALIVGC